MSTKIYTGFKVNLLSLVELHHELMKFRAQLKPLATTRTEQLLLGRALGYYDQAACFGIKGKEPFPLMEAEMEHYRAINDIRKGIRRPLDDFSFVLSLFPDVEGHILGICYTEQQDWFKMWMEKPFIQEYKYYNNTDQPDNLSVEEWEERSRLWDMALGSCGIPNMNGYTATIVDNENTMFSLLEVDQKLLDDMPFEKRLKTVMVEKMLRSDFDWDALSVNSKSIMQKLKWFNRPESEEWRAAAQAELEPLLTKRLTMKDLMKWPTKTSD